MLSKDLSVIFKIKICFACIHDKQILFNNIMILFKSHKKLKQTLTPRSHLFHQTRVRARVLRQTRHFPSARSLRQHRRAKSVQSDTPEERRARLHPGPREPQGPDSQLAQPLQSQPSRRQLNPRRRLLPQPLHRPHHHHKQQQQQQQQRRKTRLNTIYCRVHPVPSPPQNQHPEVNHSP